MGGDSNRAVGEGLRSTRGKLLAVAGMAAMIGLMLPTAAAKEREVKERVEPVYPQFARAMGIKGTVVLAVTVDCVGRVLDVEAVSGENMLVEAAVQAVRRWRFTSGAGEARVQVEVGFFGNR